VGFRAFVKLPFFVDFHLRLIPSSSEGQKQQVIYEKTLLLEGLSFWLKLCTLFNFCQIESPP